MANQTLLKFGYPATLIKELDHWAVLLRPAQVTLGSLVLAAKSDATAYSDLPDAAFAEQALAVRAIERALRDQCDFDRLNYLMLMMVDPNVHFHVIPRYETARQWNGVSFPDAGWPGPPDLKAATELDEQQLQMLGDDLRSRF